MSSFEPVLYLPCDWQSLQHSHMSLGDANLWNEQPLSELLDAERLSSKWGPVQEDIVSSVAFGRFAFSCELSFVFKVLETWLKGWQLLNWSMMTEQYSSNGDVRPRASFKQSKGRTAPSRCYISHFWGKLFLLRARIGIENPLSMEGTARSAWILDNFWMFASLTNLVRKSITKMSFVPDKWWPDSFSAIRLI